MSLKLTPKEEQKFLSKLEQQRKLPKNKKTRVSEGYDRWKKSFDKNLEKNWR